MAKLPRQLNYWKFHEITFIDAEKNLAFNRRYKNTPILNAMLNKQSHERWVTSGIMQLMTYTQVIREGETNLRFKGQHKDNLLAEVQREIASLAITNQQKNQQSQSIEHLLSHILYSWPIPVCLFNDQHQVTYRNGAMK